MIRANCINYQPVVCRCSDRTDGQTANDELMRELGVDTVTLWLIEMGESRI